MQTEQEQRDLSQKLHQKSEKLYKTEQGALCFFVLGWIFVVIGIIFIFLAQKRSNNVMVGFDFNSIAFYIFVITLSGGAASVIISGIVYFFVHKSRKKILRQIDSLK